MVIVSRYDPDAPRALIIYAPLTTQNRGSKYEVALPNLRVLREASVANVQGIASLSLTRLERKLGEVPGEAFVAKRRTTNFLAACGEAALAVASPFH